MKKVGLKEFIIKITIEILIIIVLLGLVFLFSNKTKEYKDKLYNYKENTNINYKVYLKENNFYENNYLDSGYSYISSLINIINFDISYNFEINNNTEINFTNNLYADLIIATPDDSKIYYKKRYKLDEESTSSIKNNIFNQHKNINIDYQAFNQIVQNYMYNYNVKSTSYLLIYFDVDKKDLNQKIFNNNKKTASIRIPLNETSVDIKVNNINEKKIMSSLNNQKSNDNILLIILIILVLIILIAKLVADIIGYFTTDIKFDRDVRKILRTYDRFIVELSEHPIFNSNLIYRVKDFNELLDVRDNLKQPIKYYLLKKHKKCIFFVKSNDEIYSYVMKNDNYVDEEIL